MDDVFSEISSALTHSALFAFFYALYWSLFNALIPRLFPLNMSRYESDKVARLAKKYRQEIQSLDGTNFLFCLMAMILAPLLNYGLLIWILSTSAGPDDRLFFFGGGVVVFFSLVGGAFYGMFITRIYISAHYHGVPRLELSWLYPHLSDAYGGFGRFITVHAGALGVALMLLPALAVLNYYTLVGPDRVEIPDPHNRYFSRLTLPNSDIAAIVRTAEGSDDVYLVKYRDGRVLTTDDCIWAHVNGEGFVTPDNCFPADAVGFLSDAAGVLITE